ncbi:unnamed protein product [Brassica rapa]|uniref:Transcription elongation factor TFIIS/CRSP70 N-terminal sub-type domain-containing protein n=1 Tax=Brassica campestris TaxID=3711 RepID=A0A8D9DK58_BRACM|nr:unnamed protein product [Brassica rapa]
MKDLIAAALKSTYDTRSPGGVERCIDLLIRLKSMSLSVKDILYFSKSIFKLETLRRHRNPRIREVSHSLLTSLLKTLYSQGSDKSAGLNAVSLKRKEAKTGSLTNKRAKTNLLVSDQKQDHKTLARAPVVRRTETKKTDACKSVTTKPVTTTALPQQSRRDIKDGKISEVSQSLFDSWLSTLYGQGRRDQSLKPKKKKTETLLAKTERDIKDGGSKVTTKTLLPPPRRVAACKNPNSTGETEEMVELFEAAKKAADVANAKGILSGKADALRCVEAISLLVKMNVTPKPNEPRRMLERLQGLTKHKDRTICNAASALLQLWRQRIREDETKAAYAVRASKESLQRRGN